MFFHSCSQVGINNYDEFVKEINKFGWIGNTNIRRKYLLEICNNNQELFDIIDMRWIKTGNIYLHLI